LNNDIDSSQVNFNFESTSIDERSVMSITVPSVVADQQQLLSWHWWPCLSSLHTFIHRRDGRRGASMTKVSGQVKWFSNRKGYGFVCSSQVQGQDEIFVHHTSIVSPDGAYRTLVRKSFQGRSRRVPTMSSVACDTRE
jgi:hypothetical protein